MREGVTKSYPWRSGRDELVGISGLKHARLCGHDGVLLYTPAGESRGVSPKKMRRRLVSNGSLEETRRCFLTQRIRRGAGERQEKEQSPGMLRGLDLVQFKMPSLPKLLFGCGRFCGGVGVFLGETLNAASRVH
jgi:hypothetical protein